jgi:hypothetical protein
MAHQQALGLDESFPRTIGRSPNRIFAIAGERLKPFDCQGASHHPSSM